MPEQDDIALLRDYAERNCEEAFATLVSRHVNLVFSVGLRHTGNPNEAEEITQAVFIILARKAPSLRKETILSGWLYHTARLTAANYLRTELRRRHREQEAHMQSLLEKPEPDAWGQIAPLLDSAMAELSDLDRNAIVLRFFQGRTSREMAAALRVRESAAQKRVTRAVERLRTFFLKRGVTLSTAVIVGTLSAYSVQAAPVGLAASATAGALKGTAVAGSTLTIVKGALKIMAWTKAKTAIAVTVGVLVTAGTTGVVVEHYRTIPWNESAETEVGPAPAQVAMAFFTAFGREDWDAVAELWPAGGPQPGEKVKTYGGGLQVLRLGKPFQRRGYPQVFVPYKIRLRTGEIVEHNLALRRDNPERRWFFDGGL